MKRLRLRLKGFLLFEVAFVALLISLASVFLFRGYGVFLRIGAKSADYLKLITLAEKKIFDLEIEEKKAPLSPDIETSGSFDSEYSWQLAAEDSEYDNFKKARLTVNSTAKRKHSLDTLVYLLFKAPAS